MGFVLLILVLLTLAFVAASFIVATRRRNGATIESATREEFRLSREDSGRTFKELREELSNALSRGNEAITGTITSIGTLQQTNLQQFSRNLEEINRGYGLLREEITKALSAGNDTVTRTLGEMARVQQTQLEAIARQLKELTLTNQTSIDRVKDSIDVRLNGIQESNDKKLEEMRKTVDERLHGTLEKRLGESFKLVSERLEAVQRGLGEMQGLATGVGDLKRVLTNVKARGTWAEVQLGTLLDEVLTRAQYEKNVKVRDGSNEAVEYAIKLPGKHGEPGSEVWLPVDSKFPQEDYARLQDAADRADPKAIQEAIDGLLKTIRLAAKDIHDKYINPPNTTDFAIMFLATEGLYAEIVRQPSVVQELSTKFRVVVAGPTTFTALLSSLRMGFQTLAIEQRASEVWNILAGVKTEFGRFGEVLDKVKKQLATATKTIEDTGVRTRAIERRLRSVEELPDTVAEEVLKLPGADLFEDDFPDADEETSES